MAVLHITFVFYTLEQVNVLCHLDHTDEHETQNKPTFLNHDVI